MAQNAQNCSIQREMQKQPKIFKKCQVGEAASIWPLKASKLDLHGNFYQTKLVSKYIHNRIIYKEKWCHSIIYAYLAFFQFNEWERTCIEFYPHCQMNGFGKFFFPSTIGNIT